MRESKRTLALLGTLVLVIVSGCSAGSNDKPRHSDQARSAPAVGTAWAAAHLKALGGLQGRFRSQITSRACSQPPTKPCVVGGALLLDSGTFTVHRDSSSFLHVAFGNGADVTELPGYRVRNTEAGDTFVQPVGGGRSARCWTEVSDRQDLGSAWDYVPGFDVVNDAEPNVDPPVGQGAAELEGHAPTRLVLRYLGVADLDPYDEFTQLSPVHLRIDAKGHAAGFWIDGEELATALVGPEPDSPTATNPAALVNADDSAHAKAVRAVLTPLHADFRMYAFGSQPKVVAPPKALLLSPEGRAQHLTCRGAR